MIFASRSSLTLLVGWLSLATLPSSCGDGPGTSGPQATGGSSTGGVPSGGAGGTSATGGGSAAGVPSGGTPNAGQSGTGGVGPSGAGGSGGAPRASQDPATAPAIAAQDAACRAACEVAMGCVTVFETMHDCLAEFACLYAGDHVDWYEYPPEVAVPCLDAGTVHMQCVSQLDCNGYYDWWNEEPDPFPCKTEQYAEEAVCDRTYIFSY